MMFSIRAPRIRTAGKGAFGCIILVMCLLSYQEPVWANNCTGGQITITNKNCSSTLYVFACYGQNGANGHGAQSLARDQNAVFDLPPGSTFSENCGTPPA